MKSLSIPYRYKFYSVVILMSAPIAPLHAQDINAYCTNVEDDDQVKEIPPEYVGVARQIFGILTEDDDKNVRESTVYRCMHGRTWLCNYGANGLFCVKADVSRTSKGADAYCKDFPGSNLVPMAATGHATSYSWRCVGKKARVTNSEKVDPRGFIANQWEPLAR